MAAIFRTTFSNAFSWTKMYKFRLIFPWSLFTRVQTRYYLNQWWPSLLTHLYVTLPVWSPGHLNKIGIKTNILYWCELWSPYDIWNATDVISGIILFRQKRFLHQISTTRLLFRNLFQSLVLKGRCGEPRQKARAFLRWILPYIWKKIQWCP